MSESLKRSIEEFLTRTLPAIREAIVKVEQVREGIDIYLSDASAARMLAGKLRAEFQGSLNESYKLISRRPSGKRIGRLTISVRIPDLEPGSVFSLDNRYYILLGRTRRGLLAIETSTGREIVLPGAKLENANPAEYPGGPMMRRYMLLSKEGGTVVFLDADKDFQEVVEYPEERVKVLTDRFEAGATYWVFITRGRAYVLKRSEEDAE